MAQQFKLIQVGNQTFELPITGKNPDWGEEVSAILEALAESSQVVQGPNDVLLSSANILNNQTAPVNFGNLAFNTANVLSIDIDYFIIRRFDPGTGPEAITENGKIYANFDGSNWKLSQTGTGEVGIAFTITPAGQIQYSSTDISGYISGTARFRARTIDEAS